MNKYDLYRYFQENIDDFPIEHLKKDALKQGYTLEQIRGAISVMNETNKYIENRDRKKMEKVKSFLIKIVFIGIIIFILDKFISYLLLTESELFIAFLIALDIGYSVAFMSLFFKIASNEKKPTYMIMGSYMNFLNYGLIRDVYVTILRGIQSKNKHDTYLVNFIRFTWVFFLYFNFKAISLY